jgi:cytoskeletal protein RodZ
MRKNPIQSKSINHSVSPKEAASVASLKGTITLTLKKKTLSQVYNQVKMCEELGFPNFSKGEPINNLMREIKREVKKESKQEKMGWKELLDFWPLSIVVPGMLILIMMANVFQW